MPLNNKQSICSWLGFTNWCSKAAGFFFFSIYCAPLILLLSSLLAGLGCNTLCLDAIVMIYVKCEQMTNVFFCFFFPKSNRKINKQLMCISPLGRWPLMGYALYLLKSWLCTRYRAQFCARACTPALAVFRLSVRASSWRNATCLKCWRAACF